MRFPQHHHMPELRSFRNTESELDLLFAEKLFAIRPGKLLLYGKHDPIMERQANVAGVPCRIYPDAHTLYKQLART